MDRKKLIAYSLMCNGEYNEIVKLSNADAEVSSEYQKLADEIKNVITIFDEDYPKSLLELRYPPFCLYYKGNKNLLKKLDSAIAVVGSRIPTEYATKATQALCKAKKDNVIISGLAKGIDACAHENANETIAVLGCGINYIYPFQNVDLFKKIEKEGLIISEYPGNSKPLAYHFPFRNRIVAAMSSCVYVAECKQKSGTMTTINEALELGKNVKVLPFDIFTASQKGVYNNTLINEGAQTWDI